MYTRLHRFLTERCFPLFPATLLALLTGLLFWPAVHFELVNLDDIAYISENRMIHNGLTWSAIQEAFTSVYQVMWAPGLWISYMMDIELFGTTAWGSHLTNVLLHTANTFLVYWLFRRWCRRPWQAFFAAAIWAWHPLRVESVAWVSARKDVLSGLFFLACLLFYDKAHTIPRIPSARTRRQWIWIVASWLSLAIGLTVKPMLVATPAVLLLLDIWPLQRVPFRFPELMRRLPRLIVEKTPFWLLAAASAWLAISAHAGGSSLGHASLWTRLFGIPLNYSFYLLKTLFPVHLTILYPDLAIHPMDILFSMLILLFLTLWAWNYRRKSTAPLIGWLWFLGVMLPTSGIIRFGVQSLADRFTYLPALGLSLMVLPFPPGHQRLLKSIRLITAFALLLAAAALTRHQLSVWQNSDSLYNHLLHYSPSHAFGLANRAKQLQRQGRLPEAEEIMLQACESPTSGDTQHIVLADIMAAQGKTQQALDYLYALDLRSPGGSSGLYHFALAMILNQAQNYPEAAREAGLAAEALSPHDLIRHDLDLLGMVIAYRMNDQQTALEWAQNLFRSNRRDHIGPDDLLPYYIGQWKRFQRVEAIEYFRTFLSRHPDDIEALNNLSWLLATSEWSPIPPDEVVAYIQHATELSPGNPILLDTLGVALAHASRFADAEQTARQARDIIRHAGFADSDLDRAVTRHILVYQTRKPWREENAVDRISQKLNAL